MKKVLIIILLVLLTSDGLNAWNSPRLVKMMRTENGLSNDYIVSVDIDEDGTVWIGTEEGMNSFDGVRIKSYTKNMGILPGNALNDVIADRYTDSIWVATQRFGAAVYDGSEDIAEFFAPNLDDEFSLISREITHMEQDADGNIWFSAFRRGIEKYDVKTGKFIHYNSATVKGMEDWSIISFALGNDGKVYIGHYNRGLTVLDPYNMTAVNFKHDPEEPSSLPSDVLGCVYKDRDNNIWVGTSCGLALFRPVTNDFKVYNESNSGLPNGRIYSIMVTKDRRIYVSPNFMGVWVADLDKLANRSGFVPFLEAEEISSLPVRDMCEDKYGNLWIGSYGRGVLFVGNEVPGFNMVSSPDVLSATNVTAVSALNDGSLLVGTHGGGVDILDSGLSRQGIVPDYILADNTITGLLQDSAGDIWIGSFNGNTVVVDSCFANRKTLDMIEAYCFLESGNEMWVGTHSGLYRVDKNSWSILKRYSSSDLMPENYVRCLCRDSHDNLWVGLFSSGLIVFDKEMNELARFNIGNGMYSNLVSSLLCVDEKVYAATGEGLICFEENNGKYQISRILTMADGISSDAINALILDHLGRLWFSTNLSVCLLDQDNWEVKEYRNHSDRTFPIGNFNGNSCAVNQDGNIFFGSTEGLVGFVPMELEFPNMAPGVTFRELILHGDDVAYKDNKVSRIAGFESCDISWRHGDFVLTFSVDDYGLSEVVNYYGKIDKSAWFPVVANSFNLSDLSSGKHSVQVKARIRDGEFGPVSRLNIRISYPFWWSPVSWVIYLLIVFAIAGAVLVFLKRKNEKENSMRLEREAFALAKEANEERLRFYTNITHELRTPLTLIVGPVDDLKNEADLPESAHRKVLSLSKNVDRLLELVNRLLDFRKVETSNYEISLRPGDLSTVVESAGNVFFESKTNPSVKFRMNITKGVMGVFDAEIVTIILNNLLSNAFKFTRSGVICLNMYPLTVGGTASAEIIVSDTGCGISRDQIPHIFERYYQVKDGQCVQGTGIGLSLVKSLVALHKGTVEVESEVGHGSNFRVVLPLEEDKVPLPSAVSCHTGEESALPVGRIVVVAEDNEDICSYIVDTLTADGFSVYEAHNGSEAYSRIVECNPDLIISDIMMPVLDGLALCRMVKQDMRFSHIPLILLTAKDSNDDRSEGYKAGADSYLVKPFTGELLKSRIRNIMESRSRLVSQFASSIGSSVSINDTEAGFNDVDKEFLKKITGLVEENISSESLDVSFLADRMNMSNSTLYRKLKSLTGFSANEFIRKLRMHKAKELLSSGGCNVSEAAWSVGMGSMIYFRQCFMHEFGMLPSEFRRRHGKMNPGA